MIKKRIKNEHTNSLIDSIRAGDHKAATELVELFAPLIGRVVSTIYYRYNKLIPVDELITNARQLLVYLAGVEYKKNTEKGFIAHFPAFARAQLHARMVQMFRPSANYRRRALRLVDFTPQENPETAYDKMVHEERVELVRQINDFMWRTFNERELDVIINHVIGGVPRPRLAERYNVSIMRMKVIHKAAMRKLKDFLTSIGINSLDDI